MNSGLRRIFLQQQSLVKSNWRPLSSKANDANKSRITVTDDGQTIVCWHPPQPFPYEHTQPYNEQIASQNQNSVLNIETIEKGENIYFKAPMNRLEMEQLQAITYTNKNHWRRRRFDGLQMRPKHPRKGV